GPNSVEIEDTYLRLDRDLAELLEFLDKYIGKENVLVFLSADHGAAHVPSYLNDLRIPAGTVAPAVMRDSVNSYLNRKYGKANWVMNFINEQVYLNRALIEQKQVNLSTIQDEVATYLLRMPGVAKTITAETLQKSHWSSGIFHYIQNGWHPQRSGDVMVVLQPGWFDGYGKVTGTTHGSPYSYDTHVPLLFYGWQVKQGESAYRASITDIAPTLAYWLSIMEPNGCMGNPLQEHMK
ncbi:MAG: alkaline phosphatase family protein, partial [Hymenobacteraceae bacterium]|nr:alkaline phosphatase family protein [Hymenobacteraceae bacterium]MDX5395661.1 alkaline phosphatase family protein [Hymenobacteraceae bacterium]MDX5511714.1 alkaline phosphatase family protein [Hymenobacteraceae bacterium]